MYNVDIKLTECTRIFRPVLSHLFTKIISVYRGKQKWYFIFPMPLLYLYKNPSDASVYPHSSNSLSVVTKPTTCSVISSSAAVGRVPAPRPRDLWVISPVFDDAEAARWEETLLMMSVWAGVFLSSTHLDGTEVIRSNDYTLRQPHRTHFPRILQGRLKAVCRSDSFKVSLGKRERERTNFNLFFR